MLLELPIEDISELAKNDGKLLEKLDEAKKLLAAEKTA